MRGVRRNPSPSRGFVSRAEDMSLPGRLVLAAFVAAAISAGAGACDELTLMEVTIGEFRGIPTETMARIQAEVIEDAEHDTVKLAGVLVPLTVAGVCWREKRKGRAA